MKAHASETSAFLSDKRFYDEKHFPNFFHRSGDFTIKEADILTITGYVMTQLHQGTMKPTRPEHKRFLAVIKGTRSPESLEEKVYLKYLQLIEEKNKFFPPIKNAVSRVPYIEEGDFPRGNEQF